MKKLESTGLIYRPQLRPTSDDVVLGHLGQIWPGFCTAEDLAERCRRAGTGSMSFGGIWNVVVKLRALGHDIRCSKPHCCGLPPDSIPDGAQGYRLVLPSEEIPEYVRPEPTPRTTTPRMKAPVRLEPEKVWHPDHGWGVLVFAHPDVEVFPKIACVFDSIGRVKVLRGDVLTEAEVEAIGGVE